MYLDVKNLTKKFSNENVLNGVSFGVDKGEAVTVIGSSGSGKTTLLRCLNFLERADGGTIEVDGREIFRGGEQYGEKALRENRLYFGLVFQSFNLFPQYTVLKNVTLALDLQIKEKFKAGGKDKRGLKDALAENTAYAKSLLREVGLGEKFESYPSELSGGQSQRVAIARALALKPSILCFDEPTSALDPSLTGEVLRVISSLKSRERSMIIVTHEMSFAEKISDRVIFMNGGRVEECGTPQKIFKNPQSPKLKKFLSDF